MSPEPRLGDTKVEADHDLAVQSIELSDSDVKTEGDKSVDISKDPRKSVVGRIEGSLSNPTAKELRAKGYDIGKKPDGTEWDDDDRLSKWSGDQHVDADGPDAVQRVVLPETPTRDESKTALELIAEQEAAESDESAPAKKSDKKSDKHDAPGE